VGTAWGEWVASDFSNPAIRQQIAGASLRQPAPEHAPKGLEQLSQVWTAPFSHYAPPYIRSATFGYFLSAMFGAGLIILACALMGQFMRGLGQ
jgi:cobalt/nickel transport system permease protein